MMMKCVVYSALILLTLGVPAFAQAPPQQRVPPWLRQPQQQQPQPDQQQSAPPAEAQPQPTQPQTTPAPQPQQRYPQQQQQPVYTQQPAPAQQPGANATVPVAPTSRPATAPAAVNPATRTTAATQPATTTTKGKKSARKSAKKEDPPEPIPPAAPVAQMTPADLPPSPPQVSYLNGQLLVLSQNATLSEVLSAIRSRTGAQIEYPASAAQERVAARLGPGAPRDVLAQLLNGSKFDYLILGSQQQPGGVQRVILTPKQGGAGNEMAQAPVQRTPSPAPQEDVNNDEEQNETSAVQPEQEPQVAQPSPQGVQPPGQPAATAQPAPGAFPAAPFQNPPFQQQPGQVQVNGGANVQQPGQQVKTPEQLLRELQQMQQQQQQQNQNPPPQ